MSEREDRSAQWVDRSITAGHESFDYVDGPTAREAMLPPGLEIDCTRFVAGTHTSEFEAKPSATLILATESNGRLYSDMDNFDSETATRSGMFTFAPANIKQCYDFNGVTRNTLMSIPEALIERISASDDRLTRPGALEPRIKFFRPALQRAVDDYYDTVSQQDAGWRVMSESLALRVTIELLAAFGEPWKDRGTRPLSAAELDLLTQFIDANIDVDFQLSDMAAVLASDPFAFTRSLKLTIGESPHQFVIQRRLMRAKELLTSSMQSLAEIAFATGFSSQAHMTSTFTKHVGMPPGKWRKTVLS